MAETRVPTRHLLSLNHAFSIGIVLHLTELFAKGVSEQSPNNLNCYKDNRQLCIKRQEDTIAEKKPPTLFIEHIEVELVPT